MRNKKRAAQRTVIAKEHWHLYSLQSLPPSKFAVIAKQILLDPKLLVGVRSGIEYEAR